MIIIRVCGGLGNQLFQYALYKKLDSLGKDVYIDRHMYGNEKKEKRAYCLETLTDPVRYCSERDRKKLSNNDDNRYTWFIQRRVGLKESHYYEKEWSFFDRDLYSLDNVYLEGYWQNEKYFADIREDIIDSLHFNIPDDAVHLSKEIESCVSVSIHVRRGDYINQDLYDNICTPDYYERAVQYIEKCANVDKFYIFSDDIWWCKEHFADNGKYVFMPARPENEAAVDMKLMSLCKHNIIANSSFSWWAAWLNENTGKTVIAPDIWLMGHESDIYCNNWIRL